MIEAVRNLGEYALQEQGIKLDNSEDIINVLIEAPASNESYKKVLKIKLVTDTDIFLYRGIEVDEYTSKKLGQYLYRKGSPNGADYSPTSRITDPEKTFKGKILKWFQKKNSTVKLDKDEENLLINLRNALEENQETIIHDIKEVYDDIKKARENAILTVEITSDGVSLPGEVPVFRRIFLTDATSSYSEKYNTTSKSDNSLCSICGKENTEVYGFVSTYAFYTVDKPGMVTGGFNQSEAWKNFPVCRECALILEQGKQWLEQYSSFSFYGFNYLLISKPLLKTNDEVYEVLKDYQDQGKQVKLTGKYEALLDSTQNEILSILSEKPNTFQTNMLIYNESKSEFKILRYIEGIYPTDLRRLFEAKKKVDAKEHIKETKIPVWEKNKKTGEKPLTFDFGCFWHFFKDEKQGKYFLTLVNNIFKNNSINRQFLYSKIIQQVRKSFPSGFIEEPVMRGFSCLLYLNYLGILESNESVTMSKRIREMFPSTESTRISTAEKIFTEYPSFFKGEPEKAIFIVGVLSQLLMNIQRRNRGAEPFRVKLQGLRLDEKKVKALLPEIQNKLEEYESNYYRDLETLASEYFIQAQDNWSLSRDEISFYFALGMNLSKYFKTEREEEKDE